MCPWMTITSGASGTGSGDVVVHIDANPDPSPADGHADDRRPDGDGDAGCRTVRSAKWEVRSAKWNGKLEVGSWKLEVGRTGGRRASLRLESCRDPSGAAARARCGAGDGAGVGLRCAVVSVDEPGGADRRLHEGLAVGRGDARHDHAAARGGTHDAASELVVGGVHLPLQPEPRDRGARQQQLRAVLHRAQPDGRPRACLVRREPAVSGARSSTATR